MVVNQGVCLPGVLLCDALSGTIGAPDKICFIINLYLKLYPEVQNNKKCKKFNRNAYNTK